MSVAMSMQPADVLSGEDVPRLWSDRGRWGHRMHSMCSYLAMLPNSTVNVLVQWLSEPADMVYDPFAGSGKVPLEARRLGRQAFGADLNPLAVVLTRAKLADVSSATVLARLDDLESDFEDARPQLWRVPDHVRMLFSDHTLRQLVALRARLDVRQGEDAFIMALLLGILHLNANREGVPRGLTVSMPNTFAMAPGYVGKYIDEHRLEAPDVDVFERLRGRLLALDPDSVGGAPGVCIRRDATWRSPRELDGRVRLLLASPPYLNVIKYGKFNWIRLWMLGHEPRRVDARLMASASVDKYTSFLCAVLTAQTSAMHRDGLACLVIGDVNRDSGNLRLAEVVAERVEARTGWHPLATIADKLPEDRKVSRIWGTRKGAATKTDRLLILRPPGGTAELPAVPEIDWRV